MVAHRVGVGFPVTALEIIQHAFEWLFALDPSPARAAITEFDPLLAAAVQQGATAYLNRQYSTIGVVGVVLFMFGTGPVKGFAVTLSIGIVTTVFTAVFVSRALVNLIQPRGRRAASAARS
jgi:preprotein translocase subunit SecF